LCPRWRLHSQITKALTQLHLLDASPIPVLRRCEKIVSRVRHRSASGPKGRLCVGPRIHRYHKPRLTGAPYSLPALRASTQFFHTFSRPSLEDARSASHIERVLTNPGSIEFDGCSMSVQCVTCVRVTVNFHLTTRVPGFRGGWRGAARFVAMLARAAVRFRPP
jgi:hypothetical protein